MTNNNKNGNNMYLNNNPSLNGYVPTNGNHGMRSKLLHQPNSFVPAQFAHEVNAFENHMSLPHDNKGVKFKNRNDYGPYHNSINIGDGNFQGDRPYDFFGNNNGDDGYDDGTFGNTNESKYVNYGGEYGRHQRTFNRTSSSRFDPTRNSYNHIDYGINSHR